jgi:hypothetical protein
MDVIAGKWLIGIAGRPERKVSATTKCGNFATSTGDNRAVILTVDLQEMSIRGIGSPL